MGGVKQSGVTTARLPGRQSVCPRLRTGTHSSHRKVRPTSVQPLHSPSIRSSIFPPIRPFTGLHPPCLPSLREGAVVGGTEPASSYLPPPTSCFSLSPPARHPHYLTTSSLFPLSAVLSVAETERLVAFDFVHKTVAARSSFPPFFPPTFISSQSPLAELSIKVASPKFLSVHLSFLSCVYLSILGVSKVLVFTNEGKVTR